ncbi:MAG: hypothetical protein M1825_004905 [Sarcosagium campestre]|nr:MAG: hypothetical protein M1825_004905 [Sarcosagium campestre]
MHPVNPHLRYNSTRRVVCYYQTHYHNGKHVSILPLLARKTGVTHVIIAAIHLNAPSANVTLNNDPYTAPQNDIIWKELRVLQSGGIQVLGMLGGAGQGSFTALDGKVDKFEAFYLPLRDMIVSTGLDGLDLDVEEAMSLAGVIRLIDRLKSDFGNSFIITLAPIASALCNDENLSGFQYEALEKAFTHKIAWYNTQFYCGWGNMETTKDYDRIIERGWPANKIVAGLVTNPANGKGYVGGHTLWKTLEALVKKYPHFGGVMGWEYFNSITSQDPNVKPWCWAQTMSRILHSDPQDPVDNES